MVSDQVGTRYPWYDSPWLSKYTRAKELIGRVCPEKLPAFERALGPLRTRPDFEVRLLPRVFDDAAMGELRQTLRTFRMSELELHEARKFGRFIVHDHPFITGLQQSLIGPVSEAAGEPVEPAYNFVSLYKKLGVCPVHMDSPQAKWTLDLCVEQSDPWPIHLSQVVPWPEEFTPGGDNWGEAVKRSPGHRFAGYSLEPGQALFFSGSSQWHYRDPRPADGKDRFCHLVFFHFVPAGLGEAAKPKNWPGLFGVPELTAVV